MKTLGALALALLATAAAAQGVGPEIAFVKAGRQDSVYLVNPDGSALRLLYKTASRKRIFTLDMKPQGGELAFEEVGTSASTATLKILTYDHAGSLASTRTLNVCRILSLDYHPSGSDLLYLDTCAGARRLNTATMTSTPLAVPAGTNKIAWRTGDQLVYNRSTATASEVMTAPAATPGATTVIGEVRLAGSMDVSTSGSKLLVDPVDYGTLSLFDMNSGSEQQDWQIGHNGRFSPDDLSVVYVSGFDVRGSYIFIRPTSGGSPVRLASKGPFGPVDWRN